MYSENINASNQTYLLYGIIFQDCVTKKNILWYRCEETIRVYDGWQITLTAFNKVLYREHCRVYIEKLRGESKFENIK